MNRKKKLYLLSIAEGILFGIVGIVILFVRDYIDTITPYGSTLPWIIYFILLVLTL